MVCLVSGLIASDAHNLADDPSAVKKNLTMLAQVAQPQVLIA
jgi:hypothetical protein